MTDYMGAYSSEVVAGIYELGRMYFDMGYSGPAERIFTGLASSAPGQTPALVGLGLLRLEQGRVEDAVALLGRELETGNFHVEAKMGLAAACLARGDMAKAKSILVPLAADLEGLRGAISPAVRDLWEAMALRCDA
ncbi:MAG: tetratricopeptide repeat protein [Bdellovibrionales bacterium]|nr:tetratricopeptide repeat protein [Bdellovibrionales bacterium]